MQDTMQHALIATVAILVDTAAQAGVALDPSGVLWRLEMASEFTSGEVAVRHDGTIRTNALGAVDSADLGLLIGAFGAAALRHRWF